MSGIRTNAAAVMLGVSPNTLRSWERRYGFPVPHRSPGGHRQYSLDEIDSLRATLAETHNVSSAIALARQRGEGPSSGSLLAAAFASFNEAKANELLEQSLALRSIERTIEEVLLDAVGCHRGFDRTAEYEFGWRYASGWLAAHNRLAPPTSRPGAVLVLDAAEPLELDALYGQAFELLLRRAGLRTLLLSPAVAPSRLTRAVRVFDARAVVLTGHRITLDSIARLVYTVRGAVKRVVLFDYRGAVPDTDASTVCQLGEAPIAARDLLLSALAEPEAPTEAAPPTPRAPSPRAGRQR